MSKFIRYESFWVNLVALCILALFLVFLPSVDSEKELKKATANLKEINYRITCVNDDGAVWFEREAREVLISRSRAFVILHGEHKSYVSGDCLVEELDVEN